MLDYAYILYVELLVLLVLAVISDTMTYKIKNSINYSFILIGIATNTLFNGFSGFKSSLLGVAVPVLTLIIFFGLRMLGAGDIKLFSAIGAVIGVKSVLYIISYSFICGGAIALIVMAFRKNAIKRFVYFLTYLKSCFLTFSLLPYTDFENKSDGSKMHFSYAIAFGTAAYMALKFVSHVMLF